VHPSPACGPSVSRPHGQQPVAIGRAVAAPTARQSASNGKAETYCQECGGLIPPGKRVVARFCSDKCRVKSASRAFRERKRAVTDSAAALHPGEPERPLRTPYDGEPDWVTAELKPPALACEQAG
jgi:hypothetical protein